MAEKLRIAALLVIAGIILLQVSRWYGARIARQGQPQPSVASGLTMRDTDIYKNWNDMDGVFDGTVVPQRFQELVTGSRLKRLLFNAAFRNDFNKRYSTVLDRYSDGKNLLYYDIRQAVPFPQANGAYVKMIGYSPAHNRMFIFFYWPAG